MLKMIVLQLSIFVLIYIISCALFAAIVGIWISLRKHGHFIATFWEIFFEKFVEIINPLNWLDLF
ncbi:MAG: hypothetical protein J6584_00460 [Lactobacillus sp.]|nr:hypothetical protein [Lactobacillus sp.]